MSGRQWHAVNISYVLLCLSANHLNADFDLLEKLSVGAAAASDALVEQGDVVAGAVVLATCNRFEAYLDIDEPVTAARAVAVEAAFEALSASSGVSLGDLRASITIHCDDDVAGHLFAVTSGLESVVIGEDEISGQVARALIAARAAGTSTGNLERLFQRAAHTSKGVRNTTALGGTNRSLVKVALEMASSRVPDWSATRVLVVGTGRYAATTMNALKALGVLDLRTFSRSGKGAAFSLRHGSSLELDLTTAISDVDVVVTCTTSMALFERHFVDSTRRIVIDLGLPRNVDPAVGALDGVELLDLETVRLHAPLDLLAPAIDARGIVSAAAEQFTAEAGVEPAIVAFRSHVLDLLETELARARKNGATAETESAMRHLVGVLVHSPSVRARELALEGRADEFAAAVETVFGVTVEQPAASSEELSAG